MTDDRKIKLVIFDLDGTLIDSLADIAAAANDALRQLSLPTHPLDSYNHFVGNGLENLVRRIAEPERSATVRESLVNSFKKNYEKNWNHETRPYPGIVEMLKSLEAMEISTGVLSNKPHAFTRECIGEFFPDHRFAQVFGQRSTIPIKPDPAGALNIASSCGCSPENCLFVGDSAVDILTGKGACMLTTGVTWGFRERLELERAGADFIIDSPAELIPIVLDND